MYLKTQSLCHLPMARIFYTETPFASSRCSRTNPKGVATIISRITHPEQLQRALSWQLRRWRVSGAPDLNWNKGCNNDGLLCDKCSPMATTGQYAGVAGPMYRIMPQAYGFVLERLTRTVMRAYHHFTTIVTLSPAASNLGSNDA